MGGAFDGGTNNRCLERAAQGAATGHRVTGKKYPLGLLPSETPLALITLPQLYGAERNGKNYGTARDQSYDERYNTAYQTTYQCVVVRRIELQNSERCCKGCARYCTKSQEVKNFTMTSIEEGKGKTRRTRFRLRTPILVVSSGSSSCSTSSSTPRRRRRQARQGRPPRPYSTTIVIVVDEFEDTRHRTFLQG